MKKSYIILCMAFILYPIGRGYKSKYVRKLEEYFENEDE